MMATTITTATYTHTYIHTYIHTHIHTYIHTSIYTYNLAVPGGYGDGERGMREEEGRDRDAYRRGAGDCEF